MSRRRSSLTPHPMATAGRFVFIALALIFALGPVLYGFLLSLRPFNAIVQEPLNLLPSLGEIDFSAYTTATRSDPVSRPIARSSR